MNLIVLCMNVTVGGVKQGKVKLDRYQTVTCNPLQANRTQAALYSGSLTKPPSWISPKYQPAILTLANCASPAWLSWAGESVISRQDPGREQWSSSGGCRKQDAHHDSPGFQSSTVSRPSSDYDGGPAFPSPSESPSVPANAHCCPPSFLFPSCWPSPAKSVS